MRELIEHENNLANRLLKVQAVSDIDGPGGAEHVYTIDPPDGVTDILHFQNGPIGEVGVNGTTHEALIAIVLDRLRAFQSGPYACRENLLAITKLEEALMWLHKRTQNREARGVEGTHEV